MVVVEEVGFLQEEAEDSEVTASGDVGITVVAVASEEMSMGTGVNSLVVVGVRLGVVEMGINKGEVEVAVQVDQSPMPSLHETFHGDISFCSSAR